ncbi:MAG: arginine deiminase family protein [Rudaea sp.]
MRFTRAIVRPPSRTFADGLTHANLGKPDLEKARVQHATYCSALEHCGLTLTFLDPDDKYPDSTFVEDPAVLTTHAAILTNPGAASRNGEVSGIASVVSKFYARVERVRAPGTLEGGDICQADDHFFIGLSQRTNPEGARQLAEILAAHGYTSSIIDIRNATTVLHLKTGMSYLGDGRVIAMEEIADDPAFAEYEVVRVPPAESYAANFLRINDHVIVAAGFPGVAAAVRGFGHEIIPLDMSEFRKMDGSLSCLSLRF